jgi:hypothetical protein
LVGVDGGRHELEVRRPGTGLPLADVTQPLGVTALQTEGTAALVIAPEFVTARRVIAGLAPVAHSRELGPGKQLKLRHAANYPGRHTRSHAHS